MMTGYNTTVSVGQERFKVTKLEFRPLLQPILLTPELLADAVETDRLRHALMEWLMQGFGLPDYLVCGELPADEPFIVEGHRES